MSKYLTKESEKHKVTHTFSGKLHFFKVKTDHKTEHDTSIQVNCSPCRFMGVQGVANGKICSHILAVLKKIVKDGEIKHDTS